MTNEQLKELLLENLKKRYKNAKIHITIIHRFSYEENYSRRFYVPAAINFLEPLAVIEITENKKKEMLLAFIDKRSHGHICQEDKREGQKQSPIASFDTKV